MSNTFPWTTSQVATNIVNTARNVARRSLKPAPPLILQRTRKRKDETMARIIVYLKDCTLEDVYKLMKQIRKSKIVEDVAHVTEEQAKLTKPQRDSNVLIEHTGGGSFRIVE
jgi:hypothetical protein